MVTETSPALMPGLIERLDRVQERIRRLTGELRPDQLLWTPPQGGWSIAQVIEHLLVTDNRYEDRIRAAMARGRARHVTGHGTPWRPSMAGRFLHRSVRQENPNRLTTPAVFVPSLRPRPSVVPSYLTMLDEIRGLMREAEENDLDLGRLRFSSPAARLLRVNLGDAFLLSVSHAERHAGQIERIRAHADFPT
jgi:hypothetical protein